jgi:hypothetical protein
MMSEPLSKEDLLAILMEELERHERICGPCLLTHVARYLLELERLFLGTEEGVDDE